MAPPFNFKGHQSIPFREGDFGGFRLNDFGNFLDRFLVFARKNSLFRFWCFYLFAVFSDVMSYSVCRFPICYPISVREFSPSA